MKAIFRPKDLDRLPIIVQKCIGKPFDFKPARPVDGVPQYWPNDKNWPGSILIPETDLEFEEEQRDVYCHKCSEASGSCRPIHHLSPPC